MDILRKDDRNSILYTIKKQSVFVQVVEVIEIKLVVGGTVDSVLLRLGQFPDKERFEQAQFIIFDERTEELEQLLYFMNSVFNEDRRQCHTSLLILIGLIFKSVSQPPKISTITRILNYRKFVIDTINSCGPNELYMAVLQVAEYLLSTNFFYRHGDRLKNDFEDEFILLAKFIFGHYKVLILSALNSLIVPLVELVTTKQSVALKYGQIFLQLAVQDELAPEDELVKEEGTANKKIAKELYLTGLLEQLLKVDEENVDPDLIIWFSCHLFKSQYIVKSQLLQLLYKINDNHLHYLSQQSRIRYFEMVAHLGNRLIKTNNKNLLKNQRFRKLTNIVKEMRMNEYDLHRMSPMANLIQEICQ